MSINKIFFSLNNNLNIIIKLSIVNKHNNLHALKFITFISSNFGQSNSIEVLLKGIKNFTLVFFVGIGIEFIKYIIISLIIKSPFCEDSLFKIV